MSEWNTYSGTSIPPGKLEFFPEGGVLKTLGDSSVWLRTGTAVAKGLYPQADLVPDLFVNGLPANMPAAISITQVATNGAGTILVCFADATNIYRSTDNGLTWALVAHGLGVKASAVCWGNGQFILAGNTGNNIVLANSTTGSAASWTNRVVTGMAISTAAADSIRLGGWNGTEYRYVLAGDTANGSTGYSTNGTAWTAASVAVSLTAPVAIAGLASKWVAFGSSSNTGVNGNNGGALSVSGINSGLAVGTPLLVAGNGLLVLGSLGIGVSSSNDGVTFTNQSATVLPSGTFLLRALGFDGTRFIMINTSNQLILSPDFNPSNITLRGFSTAPSVNGMQIVGDGTVMNYFDRGAASSVYYRTPNIATSDYTGTPKMLWSDPNTKQALGYIKLKG